MKGSLFLKTAVSVVMVLGFALLLTAGLNYYKFKTALGGLIASRVEVTAVALKATVESGLALGLPLAYLRDTQAVIQRLQADDDTMLDIAVFSLGDGRGRIVYDTAPSLVGAAAPPAWVTATESHGVTAWRGGHGDSLVVGVGLANAYDQVVGGLTIRYSRAGLDRRLGDLRRHLLLAGGLLLGLGALLTLVAMYRIFRPIRGSFAALRQALAGEDPAAAVPPFVAALHRGEAELSTLEAELDRLEAAR